MSLWVWKGPCVCVGSLGTGEGMIAHVQTPSKWVGGRTGERKEGRVAGETGRTPGGVNINEKRTPAPSSTRSVNVGR